MPTIGKYNKISLTKKEEKFLRDNYQNLTNQQLADYLGLKLTRTRTLLYSLGLKRMNLQYWTDEQIEFLKNNYKKIGDAEIAEIFAEKYPKDKGWSKKHIEKKRRYLNLKRTPEQIEKIKKRNLEQGRYKMCNVRMWQTRGVTPVGEIRTWVNKNNRITVVIRTEKGFEPYNRWLWKQHYGIIPKGYNVVCKDGNQFNTEIDNLELLSNADLQLKNAKARAETPEVIKSIKRQLKKLEKIKSS